VAEKEKFKRFFVLGAVLVIVALIVWLYPTITIGSINGKLEMLSLKGQLTDAEREMQTQLRYTKAWWEMIQATTFYPITTLLFVIGLIIIVYGVITRFA
jgi:hypothetical protein